MTLADLLSRAIRRDAVRCDNDLHGVPGPVINAIVERTLGDLIDIVEHEKLEGHSIEAIGGEWVGCEGCDLVLPTTAMHGPSDEDGEYLCDDCFAAERAS